MGIQKFHGRNVHSRKAHAQRSASRRFLSLLLSLLTVGSLSLLNAEGVGYNAEEARREAVGDATLNILRYDPDAYQVSVWYGIYDPAGLVKFSELVNSRTDGNFRSPNVRVCLCNSIDLSSVTSFTPIGNGMAKLTAPTFPSVSFGGVFDGRGYVIDGLTASLCTNEKNGIAYASLFGTVQSTARICNLVIGSRCSFSYVGDLSDSHTAALAARVSAGARIANVLSQAPVSGGTYSGGLIARVEGNGNAAAVTDCTVCQDVGGKNVAGGLIGYAAGKVNVSGSVVRGTVTGTTAGGAVGYAASTVTLSGLRTTGTAFLGGTADGTVPSVSDCVLTDEEPVAEEIRAEQVGVRFHGIQLAEEDHTVSVRFIASVDRETAYTAAGYTLRLESGKTSDLSCTVLFTSLLGQKDGETICYTAEQLRGSDGYLFAATVRGLSLPIGTQLPIRVFAWTEDGTTRTETTGRTLTLIRTEGGCTVTWD